MFLLLQKTEESGGMTSLGFVGMYGSKQEAEKYATRVGPFLPSGFGNYRMLAACGGSLPPREVQETKLFNGSTYLLAEFT